MKKPSFGDTIFMVSNDDVANCVPGRGGRPAFFWREGGGRNNGNMM
jgi:hypothetical protein